MLVKLTKGRKEGGGKREEDCLFGPFLWLTISADSLNRFMVYGMDEFTYFFYHILNACFSLHS